MTVSRWATRAANNDPNVTAEELVETANRVLHRQFISRGDFGGANHFERVARNLDYFKDVFASFGFRLIFSDAWGYVGYVSPSAFNNARVPTQETIVLLCLRLLYDEGARKGYFVDGAQVLVEEDEIQTVFTSMGSRKLRPGELRDILIEFKRRGLVTFDQSESLQQSVDVTIRPTITDVVDESFLTRLQAWGALAEDRNKAADGHEERLEEDAQ
ncbi:MAG TPA: DUF4194 domain-containing protein [Rhizomicrobium sp.]